MCMYIYICVYIYIIMYVCMYVCMYFFFLEVGWCTKPCWLVGYASVSGTPQK